MISVVTLTYNKKDLLLNLAKSIAAFTPPEFDDWEWIVVDNGTDGSGDELLKLEENLFSKERLLVFSGDNRGNFASMMNKIVAREVVGDQVLFLNNDTEFKSNVIGITHKILSEDPGIGCVSGILRYPDDAKKDAGLVQHAGVVIQEELAPGNMGAEWARRNKLPPQILGGIRVMHFQAVTAACMGMRVKDFKEIGGFREEFSWCFEDVDLGLRMTHLLGKVCAVDSRIELTHVEAATPRPRNAELNWRLLRGYWGGRVRPDSHIYAAKIRAAIEVMRPLQTKQSKAGPSCRLIRR